MDYVEKESFGGSSKMFMAAQESPKLGCAWPSLGVINKRRLLKKGEGDWYPNPRFNALTKIIVQKPHKSKKQQGEGGVSKTFMDGPWDSTLFLFSPKMHQSHAKG